MIILDTHVWVNWILLGEPGLTQPITAAINSQSLMAVSAISCFEVSLLVKQRKLELPLPIGEWLAEALSASGVDCLPVTPPGLLTRIYKASRRCCRVRIKAVLAIEAASPRSLGKSAVTC